MSQREPWMTSEGCCRDETFSSQLVGTFISCVPNFEGFKTYGPTLDATVIETLQALNNVFPSDNSNWVGTDRDWIDGRQATSSSSQLSIPPELQTIRGPTPDATVLETASAISILQGTNKSTPSGSHDGICPSRQCSKISTCLAQKGSAMLEGVKSFLSSKGSDKSDKLIASKHVALNPVYAAWDIFESKACHSRLPSKTKIDQSPGNEEWQEFTPIFSQQDTCCLHYDDDDLSESASLHQQGDRSNLKRPQKMQTLWGIARINIFDDCSKTYEIMGTTPYRPANVPEQLDGIFVIGAPKKNK